MSDNDRRDKKPQQIKHDDGFYESVEELSQILNSGRQNRNNIQEPNQATPQPYEASLKDEDFDLSFLEAEFTNDLSDNPSLNTENEHWDIYSNASNSINDTLNSPKQSTFSKEHTSSTDHDEEKILDTLSPLPIHRGQPLHNSSVSPHSDPFFVKDSAQPQNFSFNEPEIQDNGATYPKVLYEKTSSFPSQTEQQSNAPNIQQNYDNSSNLYDTPFNHPYTIPTDQKKLAEEHYTDVQNSSMNTDVAYSETSEKNSTTDNEEIDNFYFALDSTRGNQLFDSKETPLENDINNYHQFHEESFLESDINATRNPEQNDTRTQHINNEVGVRYNQSSLSASQSSSNFFSTAQESNVHSGNKAREDTPPPIVDTYKFAEEVVDKTGPIMVPEVPYTAPEYDAPIDNLKEEFADVFNVGNVSEKNTSQHLQDDNVNKIFNQAVQSPETDAYIDMREQSANYFPIDNMEYDSSFFAQNSPYNDMNSPSINAAKNSPLKAFTISKITTKGIFFLILITIGFIGYSRFFTSSQKDKDSFIIHADNTPFKFKPKMVDTENNTIADLDIYKQTTEENEEQKSKQPFLIDTSEPLENLAALNQQASESSSSSFLDEPDIEDAVTKAINHTIPTREVQTVVVNKDNTVASNLENHTDTEFSNNSEENSEVIINQRQNSPSISSEVSDTNSNIEEHDLVDDVDKVITKNVAIPKVVPIPSPAKFDSTTQTYIASRSTPSIQKVTQNLESHYVQVASQPTSALAQDSLRNVKFKFGYLIGNRPLNIHSALIPGKGTYYRVRIQTKNRDEAIRLCEDIKNSGGNCFITR
ncbi:SPOR domain-containing protein [Bartonella sp. CB189]|uniref:SPOR domain-containing protein n=1 Tax=Bartonella sp. CB189 TaxID=3112254 RepID=UPI002F96C686